MSRDPTASSKESFPKLRLLFRLDELAIDLVRGNPVLLMIQERGADADTLANGVVRFLAQNFGSRLIGTAMQSLMRRAVRA